MRDKENVHDEIVHTIWWKLFIGKKITAYTVKNIRIKINIFFLFFISIVNLIYIYFDACIFKLMMSTVRSLSLETTYLIYSFWKLF